MAKVGAVNGGIGAIVSWDGGCLLIGENVGVVPPHAHYAIQVVFGSTAGVRLRPSERDEWIAYDGAIIASRQPHSMDASALRYNAVLFVEPETREGRTLAEMYLRDGIVPISGDALDEARAALFGTWLEGRGHDAMVAACTNVVRALTGGAEPSVVSDERILRAIAYINARLDQAPTLEEVAAEACLSPSRFRHLFVEQTGMALRPYMLWRRFLKVWELVMRGESLSAAAHAAGFADAAHLSRTSKKMFGFPPSAMHVSAPLRPPPGAGYRRPENSAPTFK
jgi:AraC-like DNA-binding protein